MEAPKPSPAGEGARRSGRMWRGPLKIFHQAPLNGLPQFVSHASTSPVGFEAGKGFLRRGRCVAQRISSNDCRWQSLLNSTAFRQRLSLSRILAELLGGTRSSPPECAFIQTLRPDCFRAADCYPYGGVKSSRTVRCPYTPGRKPQAFSCWRRCRPQAADVEGTPKNLLPSPVEWYTAVRKPRKYKPGWF